MPKGAWLMSTESKLKVSDDGELIPYNGVETEREKTKNKLIESDAERVYLLTSDPKALDLANYHKLEEFKTRLIAIIGQETYDIINPTLSIRKVRGKHQPCLTWTDFDGLKICIIYNETSNVHFDMKIVSHFDRQRFTTIKTSKGFETAVQEIRLKHKVFPVKILKLIIGTVTALLLAVGASAIIITFPQVLLIIAAFSTILVIVTLP